MLKLSSKQVWELVEGHDHFIYSESLKIKKQMKLNG